MVGEFLEDLPINEFKMVDLAVVKFWRKGNKVIQIEFYDDTYMYAMRGEMQLDIINRR
jgi:hypothetical protein